MKIRNGSSLEKFEMRTVRQWDGNRGKRAWRGKRGDDGRGEQSDGIKPRSMNYSGRGRTVGGGDYKMMRYQNSKTQPAAGGRTIKFHSLNPTINSDLKLPVYGSIIKPIKTTYQKSDPKLLLPVKFVRATELTIKASQGMEEESRRQSEVKEMIRGKRSHGIDTELVESRSSSGVEIIYDDIPPTHRTVVCSPPSEKQIDQGLDYSTRDPSPTRSDLEIQELLSIQPNSSPLTVLDNVLTRMNLYDSLKDNEVTIQRPRKDLSTFLHYQSLFQLSQPVSDQQSNVIYPSTNTAMEHSSTAINSEPVYFINCEASVQHQSPLYQEISYQTNYLTSHVVGEEQLHPLENHDDEKEEEFIKVSSSIILKLHRLTCLTRQQIRPNNPRDQSEQMPEGVRRNKRKI
ncbi:hypothetical protein PPACK8108_LOCUS26298 [Phakopsora pachyrhizi]|uniref:Uncharacterized protein n=1 Tax=Phakopsora pachyrhizi TaxID=170000 RepID=A0AAV0BTY4_PHAPC|nr:hypothetical protein PPACK8108_LOCUS26298 [Phakopsora pachyrhizi]